MPDLIGQTLLGRYRVDAFLGRGGMAQVYRAWDAKRSVYVALKVLNEDLAEDYVFLRRFAREARALELLQHPHIVRFFGFEETQGLAFLVMEYIDGVTLRRQLKSLGRPLTLPEALAVLQPVCSGLHYAHGMGIFHCDVKPANIFIERGGRVVLGDFGIARLSESTTVTFSTPGTPAYMAPEQCRGEEPDARTDIYGLGVTTYEMLTLDRPFKGETEGTTGSRGERVRWEQIHATPPCPRNVNPGIWPRAEAAILQALEKESTRRQRGVLEFYRGLSKGGKVQAAATLPCVAAGALVAQSPALAAGPVAAPSEEKKRGPTIPLLATAAAVVVVLVAVVALVVLLGPGKDGEDDTMATLAAQSTTGTQTATAEVTPMWPTDTPVPPTEEPTPTETATPAEAPSPTATEPLSLAEREEALLGTLRYREGNRGVIFAYLLRTPPTIDGRLDEWAGHVYDVPYKVYDPKGSWSNRSDLYGRFYIGWDADNLYLGVEVTDDVHVQTQSGLLLYRGDDVEVQIDADLLGDFYDSRWSSDDRQIGFSAGDLSSREPEAYIWLSADQGQPGTMITVAARQTGGGYTLETAIPWWALGGRPPIEAPVGFCVSLSDNDVPGTEQQQTLISSVPTRKWSDPTTWGTLILVDWR